MVLYSRAAKLLMREMTIEQAMMLWTTLSVGRKGQLDGRGRVFSIQLMGYFVPTNWINSMYMGEGLKCDTNIISNEPNQALRF